MSDEIMRRMEIELDARRDEIRTIRTQARELASETDELLDTLQNLIPELEKLSKFAHVRKKAHAMLKEGA